MSTPRAQCNLSFLVTKLPTTSPALPPPPNPHLLPRQTLTPWDWFRLCIFGPTLLPIRFAVMLVAFVTCAALCTIATFGVPLRDVGVVPLTKWRRAFLALNPFLMRMYVRHLLCMYLWLGMPPCPCAMRHRQQG
jgi:hypothetical protein